MKTATITFRIALIARLILLLAITCSCGGKKKLINKSQFSTEIATVERVSEVIEKDIETTTETNTGSETLITNENENIEVDIDDPEKDFELHKETKDGKTTYTGKNIKNLKVANEKASSKTKDTTSVKGSSVDKSKSTKIAEAETDIKVSGSEKNVDIEKKGKFPWWILLLIIVLYMVISYFRKTLNPLGWIGK